MNFTNISDFSTLFVFFHFLFFPMIWKLSRFFWTFLSNYLDVNFKKVFRTKTNEKYKYFFFTNPFESFAIRRFSTTWFVSFVSVVPFVLNRYFFRFKRNTVYIEKWRKVGSRPRVKNQIKIVLQVNHKCITMILNPQPPGDSMMRSIC